jgi:hypothetical protein
VNEEENEVPKRRRGGGKRITCSARLDAFLVLFGAVLALSLQARAAKTRPKNKDPNGSVRDEDVFFFERLRENQRPRMHAAR